MSFCVNRRTIGFIGGDNRSYLLARKMKSAGFRVKTFGLVLNEGLEDDELFDIGELFSCCDIIILPVPVSRDKTTVFTARQDISIPLADVLPDTARFGKKIVFGALIPQNYAAALEDLGHTAIDIFENQRLIQSNAMATAEGALMIAMEKTDTTVASANFAILGFGRIASHLAKIISALGGSVTVFARRDEVLVDVAACGYKAFKLVGNCDEMARELDSSGVIFNTVPSVIITKEIIEKMNTRPLYIELASYPYGIDTKEARELNFNTIYAPSLPGRYSPRSAAEYIFEAINDYLAALEP